MKNNRFLTILAAVLLGCGLFFATGCTNKDKQLEAAITAINKQFPVQIAEGAMLQGFYPDQEGNIDITVTMQEEKMAAAITDERLKQMKKDLIVSFTLASRQDENLKALFGLIHDTQKSLALTLTLQPSGKQHQIKVSNEELQQILTSDKMNSDEMAQLQLTQYIDSQLQLLPMVQGPISCVDIKHEGDTVMWTYEVDEDVVDLGLMKARETMLKTDVLKSLKSPDGVGLVRMLLDANCSMLYRYTGNKSKNVYEVEFSENELRDVLREANSTTIR